MRLFVLRFLYSHASSAFRTPTYLIPALLRFVLFSSYGLFFGYVRLLPLPVGSLLVELIGLTFSSGCPRVHWFGLPVLTFYVVFLTPSFTTFSLLQHTFVVRYLVALTPRLFLPRLFAVHLDTRFSTTPHVRTRSRALHTLCGLVYLTRAAHLDTRFPVCCSFLFCADVTLPGCSWLLPVYTFTDVRMLRTCRILLLQHVLVHHFARFYLTTPLVSQRFFVPLRLFALTDPDTLHAL